MHLEEEGRGGQEKENEGRDGGGSLGMDRERETLRVGQIMPPGLFSFFYRQTKGDQERNDDCLLRLKRIKNKTHWGSQL